MLIIKTESITSEKFIKAKMILKAKHVELKKQKTKLFVAKLTLKKTKRAVKKAKKLVKKVHKAKAKVAKIVLRRKIHELKLFKPLTHFKIKKIIIKKAVIKIEKLQVRKTVIAKRQESVKKEIISFHKLIKQEKDIVQAKKIMK